MQLSGSAFPVTRFSSANKILEMKRAAHHGQGSHPCTTGCKNKHTPGEEDFEKAKTTNIAQKAAHEAKAASEAQQTAGKEAAHVVKMQFAEKAYEAAQAAEAALDGKERVVEELEVELKEAKKVYKDECTSVHKIQQLDEEANKALLLAEHELQASEKAFELAKESLAEVKVIKEISDQILKEKTCILEKAKQRMEEVEEDLLDAQNDLENTRAAAQQAISSANAAKKNVDRNRRKLKSEIY
ncbi:hypothetical protein L9F63_019647 [Diploptera punctata]|uniref:Uncharacterized protein n=1 Tax=Diploptera punctata TaxID=6984 RepID=A0AAD7ZTU9_DIPPU|nr:hypothetical protein L9F63_019647 [Diploptera punctata]